jgi:hypothetical protein
MHVWEIDHRGVHHGEIEHIGNIIGILIIGNSTTGALGRTDYWGHEYEEIHYWEIGYGDLTGANWPLDQWALG